MKTETVTTPLATTREKAFAFLSRVENLPKWAVEFANSLEKENGLHVAVNPQGRTYVRFEADPKSGVIDMIAGPAKDQMMTWPTRVVALPDGTSAFVMTAIQAPGLEDAVFDGQLEALRREMKVLQKKLS